MPDLPFNRKKLRVGFMGTPDFAQIALKSLIDAGYEIVCVYSQPPRPKGRGQQVQLSPVHAYAQSLNIPVYTPVSLKDPEAQNQFAAHNLDIAVVAAYGLILPPVILEAPRHGCLNIHASLLPRWRGAAPIQYSIWKGDTETGVTIMQMEKGLDTGPMILKGKLPITAETTSSDLHDKLSIMGGNLIIDALDLLAIHGHLAAEKQDDAISTYASMLKKEDGIIDWNCKAGDIDQQIRALNPWPGVWTEFNGQRLKIIKASVISSSEQKANPAGLLINKAGDVQCGQFTVLKLELIQPEGKKPMDIASALNGGYLSVGQQFGHLKHS